MKTDLSPGGRRSSVDICDRAELAVLGHIIYHPASFGRVAAALGPVPARRFKRQRHAAIWQAMADIADRGDAISTDTIFDRLKGTGSRTDDDALAMLPEVMDASVPAGADLDAAVAILAGVAPMDDPAADVAAGNEALRGGGDGTEAAIADALARSDLHLELRYDAEGCRVWNGRGWSATADKLPLPLQVAIREAIVIGMKSHTIDAKAIPRLESASGMRGIASLLSAHPQMKMPTETDLPGLLVTPSHVVDLTTGENMAHDPRRPVTRCTGVDPGPTCGLWDMIERHLRDCLGMSYDAVHRFLGAALLGRGADRKLVWLTGPGGDGKSTLAKVLRHALGDYLATVPAEVFQASQRGAHLHELGSGLAGARLAVALEVGSNLDWPRIKGLSGGDEQVSKRLYGRSYTYSRPPHLLLIANDPPVPPDRASAERVIVGTMAPPTDPDERIMDVLKDGGPERDALAGACLSWLLKGCADFLAHGLGPVTTAARSPQSLECWWERRVAEGGIVAGRGWTPLDVFTADLASFLLPSGDVPPLPNDLSAFLRSKVRWKRTEKGRGYVATVVGMTPHDALRQPSHTRIGSLPRASSGVMPCPEGGV
jgi:hypothetical protein